MAEYNEPIKNKARSLVIGHAIKTLTTGRREATLAQRSYVREAKNNIIKNGTEYDIHHARKLTEETIRRWEAFYDSITQLRTASNLKVAFLSGPNPENDLRVFCKAGVLPENIWAFESDPYEYKKAVSSALESEFPFIKIVHSGINEFLESSHQRFDIIYLDFCGPLSSGRQKTLSTITKLLSSQSISSPGILITNVSLPTKEQDPRTRELLSKLVSCYLYPKGFLEDVDSDDNLNEGPIAHNIAPTKWLEVVRDDLDYYYGQFITRVIMDHASFISPYDRFAQNSSIYKKLFSIDKNNMEQAIKNFFHINEESEGGDVICSQGDYPILWTMAALDKNLNRGDINYPRFIYDDPEFEKYSQQFLAQLSFNGQSRDLIDHISKLSILLSEEAIKDQFLSERLRTMAERHDSSDYYQFCDVVLFHQLLELLFRQIATPYHVNVEKTKRWTYKAKQTPMFMDMIVLDECRYIYDWMPTMDMVEDGLSDIQRQLSYRFALDAVAKHRRWYNPEYFFGASVIGEGEKKFNAKILTRREKVVNGNKVLSSLIVALSIVSFIYCSHK